jgi:hypothetical protein
LYHTWINISQVLPKGAGPLNWLKYNADMYFLNNYILIKPLTISNYSDTHNKEKGKAILVTG